MKVHLVSPVFHGYWASIAAALEAGRVIMLDKPAVLREAQQAGIHLHGFA